MKIAARAPFLNPWRHGTLLFDLETDPHQERPFTDDDVELRMLRLLVERMRDTDAPVSQYERLGLPATGEPGEEHLLVAAQADRAALIAEPLPELLQLQTLELLQRPLALAIDDPVVGPILRSEVADLLASELLTVAPSTSLLDLAAMAQLPAQQLLDLNDRLATALEGTS
jgi:hypothetical protein